MIVHQEDMHTSCLMSTRWNHQLSRFISREGSLLESFISPFKTTNAAFFSNKSGFHSIEETYWNEIYGLSSHNGLIPVTNVDSREYIEFSQRNFFVTYAQYNFRANLQAFAVRDNICCRCSMNRKKHWRKSSVRMKLERHRCIC